MPTNTIVIGNDLANPLFSFTDHEIRSIEMANGVDIVGAELTIDQLVPRVDYPYTADSAEIIAGADFDGILSSDGYLMATNKEYSDLRLVAYGTLIRYYRDEALVSKAYVQSVDRTGESTYKVNAISAIGLLDTQMHRGNLYRGAKFPAVLAEIIDGSVSYTVNEELENLSIYGWLPYATKRANLHQLLFACGVMVGRNSDGDMDFRFLSNDTSTVIPDGHIYMGGSVDYSSPASAVDVTEHSFMELVTDETVTEYDNTDGSETANNTLLVFRNAPLHDLQTTGSLTIVSSGVNWAILTGTGVLTGKKYTHSTRVMTRYADNTENQRENVVSVSDVTLVNVANSENVAKRVLSYYSSKKTVKTAFVVDGEKPGDLVSGKDPYMEQISGFISTMDITVSEVNKALATIITDYVPTDGGNNYTQYRLFTGEGDIDWLALLEGKGDDDPVQLTLMSGGHGGYSGENGTSGTPGSGSTTSYNYGTPGEGGEGGAPGEGGKVLTITLTVGELRALVSSHYVCGVGGASDTDGGETVILGRSSSEGATTPYGVANIFTGDVYGLPGAGKGQNGGSGSGVDGVGDTVTFEGRSWTPGASGASSSESYSGVNTGTRSGTGGFGGGAAVGSNGGNGRDSVSGHAGQGGDGATPTAREASTGYGEGGLGGHGGGGSGVGGHDVDSWSNVHGSYTWVGWGQNGAPGSGGLGGQGGPGLLLVYF